MLLPGTAASTPAWGALAAAINSGSPATVTMLQDTTIAGLAHCYPEDADITLDLHGHTITSEVPAGGTVQNYTVGSSPAGNSILLMLLKVRWRFFMPQAPRAPGF